MLFTLQLSKLTQLGHLTSKGKKKLEEAFYLPELGQHPHLGQSIHHLLGDKMPPRVVLKTVRVVFSSMTYKESSAPMPLSNFPISLVFPCHFFIQFVIFVYALPFTVEQTHSAWTLVFKRKKKLEEAFYLIKLGQHPHLGERERERERERDRE